VVADLLAGNGLDPGGEAVDRVTINRAPVLTLWATVVAERLGYGEEEALTLGKAVAGLNAYSKGKALGLFQPTPAAVKRERAAEAKKAGIQHVELLHRAVPVVHTSEGWRAVVRDRPVNPAGVKKYLAGKFKEALGPVKAAMTALAASRDPEVLAREAYSLYEAFRPSVPSGEAGWGAPGVLNLRKIREMT
jgi:hypothetical protein